MKIKYFKNEFHEYSSEVLVLDKEDGYVSNFGKQWRDHVNVQLDSVHGFKHSLNLLKEITFGNLDFFTNKTVIEIGAGAGRFSEYICREAEETVLVDLSQAIYHNKAKESKNAIRVKADFLKLISSEKFDIVLCRGVLQHTPNPKESILKLFEFVKEDGLVVFDIYPTPKIGKLHPKYFLWRPFFKTLIKYESLEKYLTKNIKPILKVKRRLKSLFFNSTFISDCFIPVYDYKDRLDLTEDQLEQWAILDTLDGMYATYDIPMSYKKVISYLNSNNVEIIKSSKKFNAFKTKIR